MLFQIVTFIDLTLCIICYPGRSLETDVRLLGDNVSRCSRSARGRTASALALAGPLRVRNSRRDLAGNCAGAGSGLSAMQAFLGNLAGVSRGFPRALRAAQILAPAPLCV